MEVTGSQDMKGTEVLTSMLAVMMPMKMDAMVTLLDNLLAITFLAQREMTLKRRHHYLERRFAQSVTVMQVCFIQLKDL